MTRDEKINRLLSRAADDTRRLDLDRIDATARTTNTWGTGEHRQARNKAESTYDAQRTNFEKLSDAQLDSALEATPA